MTPKSFSIILQNFYSFDCCFNAATSWKLCNPKYMSLPCSPQGMSLSIKIFWWFYKYINGMAKIVDIGNKFLFLGQGAALAFYILYICSLFLTPHFICFRFQQLCHNLCSDCSSCCLWLIGGQRSSLMVYSIYFF